MAEAPDVSQALCTQSACKTGKTIASFAIAWEKAIAICQPHVVLPRLFFSEYQYLRVLPVLSPGPR